MDNQNEILVKKLTADTYNCDIEWEVADADDYEDFIVEPVRVMRGLCTRLNNLNFYIFEQKIYRYDPEFDARYQDVIYFLVIRKNGITVKELHENTVNSEYLIELLEAAVDQALGADSDIESYIISE